MAGNWLGVKGVVAQRNDTVVVRCKSGGGARNGGEA